MVGLWRCYTRGRLDWNGLAGRRNRRAAVCDLLALARNRSIAGETPMSKRWVIVLSAVATIEMAAVAEVAAQPKPTLDFGFYRSKVEPIFLVKKDGYTRCMVCHIDANNNFKLERLSPGATAWTEEQSRKNFEMVAKLVNPGDPETSRLTIHPLAPEAGGHAYHSGGRQFKSKDDPDWKVLVQFVNGQK
jgi:hypothetical protein